MAIGTPVAMGNSGSSAGGSTITFTSTGVAVPSGAHVILIASWYGTQTVTMSGGSLTWGSTDKTQSGSSDTNYKVGLWSSYAASGVAAGTTFTATFNASTGNPILCGMYITGLATASWVDASGGSVTTGTGATWTTGNITTATAEAILVSGSLIDASSRTNTASIGTELQDFTNSGAGVCFCTEYDIQASTGTYSLAGSWSANSSLDRTAAGVAYKGAGGGGGGGGTTQQTLMLLGVGS